MPRYASKWLHTLLSPRECSATVQRSDWRVTPTLHPSSLWQYSLIISDPPHSGESLASWVLLCLSLSPFFFSTGQYWQGIHFHMTTWVNVCIIHEGPSLLAGSTTQRGKKKQNGRLVIHFQCWLCCMVLYAPQSLQIWVSVPRDVSLRLPTAPSFSFSLLFYAFFCCDCDTLFSSSSFIFAITAKRRQSRIE